MRIINNQYYYDKKDVAQIIGVTVKKAEKALKKIETVTFKNQKYISRETLKQLKHTLMKEVKKTGKPREDDGLSRMPKKIEKEIIISVKNEFVKGKKLPEIAEELNIKPELVCDCINHFSRI